MPFKTKEQKRIYDRERMDRILSERGEEYDKMRKQKKQHGITCYNKRKSEGKIAYCTEARNKNPLHYAIGDAKRRSRKSGLDFNITEEDIIVPEICPILGIPLFRSNGKGTDNSPSIDRIDNSKGYVKGNVAVISYKANRYKSDMSLDVLDKLREYIITKNWST